MRSERSSSEPAGLSREIRGPRLSCSVVPIYFWPFRAAIAVFRFWIAPTFTLQRSTESRSLAPDLRRQACLCRPRGIAPVGGCGGLAPKLLAVCQRLPAVGTWRGERGLIEGRSRQPEQMRVGRGRPVAGKIGQD